MLSWLVAIVIGLFLVANWGEIISWLHDNIDKFEEAWEKFKEKSGDKIDPEVRILGDITIAGAKKIIKILYESYFKYEKKWYRIKDAKKIDADKVPERIRNAIERKKDITAEMELELSK